jgi:hypothetical protein
VKHGIRLLGIIALAGQLQSCGLSQDLVFEVPQAPDYEKLSSWAAHSEFKDGSDTLVTGAETSKGDVPVFFVAPTVHFPKKGGAWNARIEDENLQLSFRTPITYQASAFNSAGPVYAPYYRQSAYQVYDVAPNEITAASYQLAYQDVQRAFDEFLRQIGPRTPFILASHSQGTDHLERLIKEHLDEEKRFYLVAAYLVGMPVDECSLPIPKCTHASQTGCFVSWRTYKDGTVILPQSDCLAVTNPLSWNSNDEYIPASQNPGSLIFMEKGIQQGVCGARIAGPILTTPRPKFRGSWLIRTKNYHRGDINLYYQSVRENALLRASQFSSPRDLEGGTTVPESEQ